MDTLKIKIPTSWTDLNDSQLKTFFNVITSVRFSTIEDVAILLFFCWGELQPIGSDSEGKLTVKHHGKCYDISKDDITEHVGKLSFLSQLPDTPVRISVLHKHNAFTPTLDDATLEDYIVCDNLYQGYIETKQHDLQSMIAEQLYKHKTRYTKGELTSVFYWWAGLKSFLTRKYPYLFKSASSGKDLMGFVPVVTVEDSMNSMLRALTKGDITKEQQVLSQPLHRALTELNEMSREYEELQKQTK